MATVPSFLPPAVSLSPVQNTRDPSLESAPRTLWLSAPSAGSSAGVPSGSTLTGCKRLSRLPLIQPGAGARHQRHPDESTTWLRSGVASTNSSFPPNFVPAVSFAAVTSGRYDPRRAVAHVHRFFARFGRQRWLFKRFDRPPGCPAARAPSERSAVKNRYSGASPGLKPSALRAWRHDLLRGPIRGASRRDRLRRIWRAAAFGFATIGPFATYVIASPSSEAWIRPPSLRSGSIPDPSFSAGETISQARPSSSSPAALGSVVMRPERYPRLRLRRSRCSASSAVVVGRARLEALQFHAGRSDRQSPRRVDARR